MSGEWCVAHSEVIVAIITAVVVENFRLTELEQSTFRSPSDVSTCKIDMLLKIILIAMLVYVYCFTSEENNIFCRLDVGLGG